MQVVLCPHPPIIVPDVGKSELSKTKKTVHAMKTLSSEIVQSKPDTIILVTPHSVLNKTHFSFYLDPNISGNLAKFNAPNAKLNFNLDAEFISNLVEIVHKTKIKITAIEKNTTLDHGSFVPLYYLQKAGYKGDVVVFNYSGLGRDEHIRFGELIKQAMLEQPEKNFVFVASGDLSHKLKPEAPAGYNEHAQEFDNIIIDSIKSGNYNKIIEISDGMRETAGECGYNSLMVALGVLDCKPINPKVISYEAPYGVGYLVASL